MARSVAPVTTSAVLSATTLSFVVPAGGRSLAATLSRSLAPSLGRTTSAGMVGHARFETVILCEILVTAAAECIRLGTDADKVAQRVDLIIVGSERRALKESRTIARRAAE